jgi:hypothetical protein
VITDGAFSRDGSQLVLRTYVSADFYSAADGAAQARIALPLEPQGETIAYARDGASLLVGSEGKGSAVWYVPLPVIGASGSGQPTPTSQESAPAQLPGRAVLVLVGISALVVLLVATTVAVVRRRRQSASVSTT